MGESIKLLIVSDVDLLSASKISEKYVCGTTRTFYDACIICGPFIHHPLHTKEDESVAIGDMASIIAQFENIICRVIYLSSNNEPITTLSQQLCLTPNSVNIYARSLPLLSNLYISGYTEKDNILTLYSSNDDSDDEQPQHRYGENENDEEIDEEFNSYEVQTSISAKIIDEILTNAPAYAYPNHSPSNPPNGIFILNYKYLHTLNHFLFFQNDLLQSSKIKLAIILSPPISSSSSSSSPPSSSFSDTQQDNNQKDSSIKLPTQLRGLTIVSPPSLRLTSKYNVVILNKINENWEVMEVIDCSIGGEV